jgi:hypothetical protein
MWRSLLAMATLVLTHTTMASDFPKDGRVDIWPNIPFIRGADLCRYKDAFSKTRTEYMDGMMKRAHDFMAFGAMPGEAISVLTEMNSLYDRNQELAIRNNNLDITLEATFKSYIDGYYRDLTPRKKLISFQHLNDIMSVVRSNQQGQVSVVLNQDSLSKIDYFAFGTYALAPNCQGEIQVTLHLVGRDGVSESFIGTGVPHIVMSRIAVQVFSKYQRTRFPSTIRVGEKDLTIVGGLNGSIDKVSAPELAEQACASLSARLPIRSELEMINSYGDWSGGVSLGHSVWAMPNGQIYHPLMRSTPVRNPWEVNAKTFLYYCVK